MSAIKQALARLDGAISKLDGSVSGLETSMSGQQRDMFAVPPSNQNDSSIDTALVAKRLDSAIKKVEAILNENAKG